MMPDPNAHTAPTGPEAVTLRRARHPRGNTDWPLVGIFAQRGKNRLSRSSARGVNSGSPPGRWS
ncbi:hypothetical protein [Streptomyces sp. E11-3]|uniref:hypothetical protein n=1 Tax=Streptomyces sp. E11-3 TaxID=3110112 RepID=UPI0039811B1A